MVFVRAFSTNAVSVSFSASFQLSVLKCPHPLLVAKKKTKADYRYKRGRALEYKACRNSTVGGNCLY